MTDLHLPWLELSVLIPLIGSMFVARVKEPTLACRWCVVVTAMTLATTLGAWLDFAFLHSLHADDPWHFLKRLFGPEMPEIFVIDHLSSPLLPLAALIYCLTMISTMRTKVRRFSFAWALVSESILLATFSCNAEQPWLIIGLLAASIIPPLWELIERKQATGVFIFHMVAFIGLMVAGQWIIENDNVIKDLTDGEPKLHSGLGILLLLGAVFIRSGVIPFHCWVTDLYERASFGTALLFTIPLPGAFAALRLILPIAPDWILHSIGELALLTAVYTAAMALVQREGRRFFCYIQLSHASLVLVGLEMGTEITLTGGLCLWLSVGLGLGGFGLTLRALESRRGRLDMSDYQGLYEHTPHFAMLFLLTGLAGVGFPGTVGFIGAELLVDGAVEESAYIGVLVVLAAALNSIAMVHAYFLLFTGTRYTSSISLLISRRERLAVLSLAVLILVGGIIPSPGVQSRYEAAREIFAARKKNGLVDESSHSHSHAPHETEEHDDDDD